MEQALRAPAPMTHLLWCRARLWPKMTRCVAARNVDRFRTHVPFQTHVHDPAARSARAVHLSLAPENKGRGECRMPAAPAASCALVVVERTRVTTSTPESPGIPARNGFNSVCRALRAAPQSRDPPQSERHDGPRLCSAPLRAALRPGNAVAPLEVYQTRLMKEMRRDHIPLVSRTRRSVLHAAPQSRDPCRIKRTV